MRTAVQLLQNAGFECERKAFMPGEKPRNIHGFKAAEKLSMKPDHWKPKFRSIHVMHTSCKETGRFVYVTSSVKGNWRQYRGRNWHERDFNNVFASAKTERAAILAWIKAAKEKGAIK